MIKLCGEQDKFHSKKELMKYLKSEIEKQGENVVIRDLDVSLIEDLSFLFNGCENIRTLDLSGWDISNVWDMNSMFYACSNLKSLDLSGWDVSKVKDMSWMFCDCENLKSLDISGWNISNVEYMSNMFSYCPAPYKVVKNKVVKIVKR